MGRTSIPCAEETRKELDDRKQDNETWDECLSRLVEGMPAENDDVDAVMEQLEALESMVESLDVSDASKNSGGGPGINEIREAVRMEVRNGMQDAMAELKH